MERKKETNSKVLERSLYFGQMLISKSEVLSDTYKELTSKYIEYGEDLFEKEFVKIFNDFTDRKIQFREVLAVHSEMKTLPSPNGIVQFYSELNNLNETSLLH